MRRRDRPARPNIWRLIILMWFTRPSTGPELQFMVRPLVTASRSCSSPLANHDDAGQAGVAGGGHPLRQALTGQLGDHGGEGADEVRCGLELGAAVQDRLEPGLLVLGQGVRARFCHRWNRSATWTASGAPVRAPSANHRAVTADHLHARVHGQPVRERLGVAALDQVQRRAGLAVDQQRAVVLTAPDREIVDPEHPRGGSLRVPGGHDQPQHDLQLAGGRARRKAAILPGPPARPRCSPAPRPAAGSCARSGRSGPRPARRTSCTCSSQPDRRTGGRPARSPPGARRPRHQRAAWNSGCGPGPTPSRTSGRLPRRHAPWPSRAAPARRPPRRSPRPGAAAEPPAQQHQGMTNTRRLATMTPRTPGRTAGLDNRWTTRSPFTSQANPAGNLPSPPNSRQSRQMTSRNWSQIPGSAGRRGSGRGGRSRCRSR